MAVPVHRVLSAAAERRALSAALSEAPSTVASWCSSHFSCFASVLQHLVDPFASRLAWEHSAPFLIPTALVHPLTLTLAYEKCRDGSVLQPAA